MRGRLSVRLLTVGVVLAGMANHCRADTSDARFLEGLRERRLFALAEAYCAERLDRTLPRDPARAELTVALIRTLSLHAVHAPPHERDPLWAKARASAMNFLRDTPPHPRAALVRLQDALTLLAQGELGQQELEAGALPADQLELARLALRQAAGLLESLDKDLSAAIPQRRRAGPRSGELSADELTNLGEHAQHQLARTQRNRALLFDRGSDDRLSLLLAATETLQRLLPQVSANEPLKAAVQLDLAECQRLLGRHAEAVELAGELDRTGLDPQTRLRARAELLRVALGQNNRDAAQRLIEQDRTIAGQNSPELDFAWFEAFLAFARAAREAQRLSPSDRALPLDQATKYERQAVDAARLLEEAYGPYWGRRASQLLIAAVPRGSLASVELLSRAADSLFLKGDFDQALAAYDDAAGQARMKDETQAAFELAYKAALVEQKRARYVEAASRLRILAKSLATHPQAAPAHLLACWNAAQAARSDPTAESLYEELLGEHLATWPKSDSADQARLWLGKRHEASANWSSAIDAYSGVSRASEHYATAIAALARRWRAELAALAAAGKPITEAASQAIHFFRRAVVGPENRWPERWTEADRTAALAAAELIVAYQPGSASDAENLLRRALAGALDVPHEWQTAAQAQLVVALAAQGGRQNDALAELKAIGAASADQMLAVLEGLSLVAGRTSEQARPQVAHVQLAAVTMLAQGRGQLNRDQQLTLDRVQVEALASIGRRDEALIAYAELAKNHLDNGAIQEGYARLLLTSDDSAQLKQALDQWRLVASRTKPRTPRWYEAKYSVALAQFKLGDRTGAATLLRFILETPPGLKGTEWELPYSELLSKCGK